MVYHCLTILDKNWKCASRWSVTGVAWFLKLPLEDQTLRRDEKPDGTHEDWLDENWQATPLPAPPMEPKLIPIVTTEAVADAAELVRTYTHHWPARVPG